MKLVVDCAVAFAMMGAALPVGPGLRILWTQDCPKTCVPDIVEDLSQAVTGTCATVEDIVEGASTAGTATSGCSTCKVCSADATISWWCNGTCGCTYVWLNQSYDQSGQSKRPQSGTGQGDGSVTATMTSNCNGSQAEFGVSVGGSKRVWKLSCTCDN